MLGGDYFRGMFNSSLDPETLAIDLRNAVLSGPSFAYSLPVHSFHTRKDRVASLTNMPV